MKTFVAPQDCGPQRVNWQIQLYLRWFSVSDTAVHVFTKKLQQNWLWDPEKKYNVLLFSVLMNSFKPNCIFARVHIFFVDNSCNLA